MGHRKRTDGVSEPKYLLLACFPQRGQRAQTASRATFFTRTELGAGTFLNCHSRLALRMVQKVRVILGFHDNTGKN